MPIAPRILAGFAVCFSAVAAQAADAAGQVAQLVDKMKAFDTKSKGTERQKALAVLDAYFDLDAFATEALGPSKAKLTPAQAQEFKQRLTDLVRRKGYPAGAGFFREGKSKVGAAKSADGKTTVPYEVYFPKEDLTVAVGFVVGGAGKVTDMIVDGEALTTDYRNQIARILAKSTAVDLLKRLEEKQKEIPE